MLDSGQFARCHGYSLRALNKPVRECVSHATIDDRDGADGDGGGIVCLRAGRAAKPNIVVIWGDDIGQFNISAYNMGMMGYKTPNIDSIAADGAMFTDWYGEQSCTAGRAAFITGQMPVRTGLTKVGLPGAPEGMPAEDPTLATLLGEMGYMTAQMGKNHLGDRNEHFPTVHGFDEFFGNLYHLNAEEEPENPDYPKNPAFKEMFGPRGVFDCVATDADTEAARSPLWRLGQPEMHRHRPADPQADGNHRPRGAGQVDRLHGPGGRRPTSRSSCGTTRPGCTSSRTLPPKPKA